MNWVKFQIIIASTIFLSLSAFCKTSEKEVIATVNGRNIYFSEFDQTYQQNLLFVSDKIVTKEKVLNDLINRELGILRAKKANLQEDATVKQKMEDVLYHAQVSKDLEPLLKKIVVTDNDVKDYYSSFPEYRTAHILMRLSANPSENEIKAAQDQAFKIYEELKLHPDKFSELANKYSQTNVASLGGDIGFQPAVRLAPEYFTAINGKSKDYLSPPARTQFGYHVIKVLAVKDFASINVPLYKKIVYDKKRDAILEKYFSELRKDASVKVEKKFLK